MDFDFVRLQQARADRVADFIEISVLFLVAAVLFGSSYVCADEPDAGVINVVDVERAEIVQPDAGVVLVTGGAWLSDSLLISRAEELKSARSTPLQPMAMPTPALGVAVAIGAVALVAFVGGAATACHLVRGNPLCIAPEPK